MMYEERNKFGGGGGGGVSGKTDGVKPMNQYLCNTKAKTICAVNHVDDSLNISVVVFPQASISTLSAHVIDCKANVIFREFFHLKSNGGGNLECAGLLSRRKAAG